MMTMIGGLDSGKDMSRVSEYKRPSDRDVVKANYATTTKNSHHNSDSNSRKDGNGPHDDDDDDEDEDKSQNVEVGVNQDILYEVLSRVDGTTLGVAACVAPLFDSVSRNESIWEKICANQWPSTRHPEINSLIEGSLGGFRNFYTQCFPLIVIDGGNKKPPFADVYSSSLKDAEEDWLENDEEDVLEELSGTSPDDFISIVDVVFGGKSVGSKVLYGIPGSGDFYGWFSNCPFRIDLLGLDGEEDEGDGMLIEEGLPLVQSIENERKDGRLWKAVWDDIRVSWILINRKTCQMANLASWRPVSGQRHWPSDKHFLICFSSILPAHQLVTRKVVRCNVVMKCKLNSGSNQESSSLSITEMSLQLEDLEGTHLNGRHSLLVLKEALSSRKSMNHEEVFGSYCEYIRVQSEFKEEKLRNEGKVDTIFIICGIMSLLSFCYFFL